MSGLLSRALLALRLEFEKTSAVSLTASADVLRVLEDGMPLKDIPLHAGVAKEGVVARVNFLDKNSYVSLSADKAKVVTPTAKGRAATPHLGSHRLPNSDALSPRSSRTQSSSTVYDPTTPAGDGTSGTSRRRRQRSPPRSTRYRTTR